MPARATCVIGIDVGTSAVKGLAIDERGTVVAGAHAGYPLSTPRPGWAEQDPELWWRATRSVLARLIKPAGPPLGLGLSGQMHGLVALDDRDRPLRPAILWNDQRTGAECRRIERRLGLERLISLTGNRALPGFTAPKLLWLRAHEPEIHRRIARIALPKDYVRLRLCGEHATDVSDASGTLLLDVARRRWSDEVLDALGIEPAWLGRVLESPAVSGTTTGGGRIPSGIPVAAGAGDQAAGALGVGVDRPGPLSIVLGTSGVVFAALDAFAADPRARVHSFCHAVPGTWHAMGVMLSAAGSLAWLRAALDAPYEALLAEAAAWPPGSE
ncbi:MAG: xylulokinase, partial [Solirubrobacteraceae bacterium]